MGHAVGAARGQAAGAKRDLAWAEAGQVAAKARYGKTVRDAARLDSLLKEGVVAPSRADDARAARDVAAADLRAAEESISPAQRAVEMAEQQSALRRDRERDRLPVGVHAEGGADARGTGEAGDPGEARPRHEPRPPSRARHARRHGDPLEAGRTLDQPAGVKITFSISSPENSVLRIWPRVRIQLYERVA